MILQSGVSLIGGLICLLIGIATAEGLIILLGLIVSVLGGGSLWMAVRKGGPYDFRP